MTSESPVSTTAKTRESLRLAAVGVAILVASLSAARFLRGRVALDPPTSPPASRPGSPTLVSKRGPLLYQVHCLRCHGPGGHGDGPDAAHLRPSPRDFAGSDWKFGASPEAIRKVILQGIPGTSMYALGTSLSTSDLDALVEHVRTLAPRTPSPDALKDAGFEPTPRPGPAPAFEVEDLEGRTRTLEFDRAKLTLLVFWGTSCAPCQEELPELETLAADFQDRGLEVIPVCVDEADRARVGQVIRGKFDRFPSYLSVDGMARLKYDVQTLPVIALIGRDGQIEGISRGGVDWPGASARKLLEARLGPRL